MLNKISINGLRGFGKKQEIEFSIPNGKEGSGLSIIVGANNTGKTTIIEALKVYNADRSNISFSEGKRNKKNNNRIDIVYYKDDDTISEIRTVLEGGSEVNVNGENINYDVPYVLPSRRYSDYNMYNKGYFGNRNDYAINQINNSKNRISTLSQFEQRIFKWENEKSKFDSVLKKVITEPFDWYIEQNDDGAYYIKITFADNSVSHTREGMGDGYWSIYTIIDALYDSKSNDIIIIDEPELSLHPTFQRRALKLLMEYSKDRQIIITTHSPYFISLEAIVNNASLIRTYKDSLGNIEIGKIEDIDRKFIKSIMNNINNPHVLGLEARELFFIEDNVIITEGQEDVVIIPKICTDLKIDLNATLFGWGAGGAENISKVLKMLKHLGYKKITAIFDGDKQVEYEKCKNEFIEYNILLLFQDDIRDKDAVKKLSKTGVTTKSGVIKDENKQKFIELITQINDYHK